MKALGQKVILEDMKQEEEKKIGSILVPSTVNENTARGKVVSVGEKVKTVKKGQVVLRHKMSGIELGEGKRVIDLEDVLAVE